MNPLDTAEIGATGLRVTRMGLGGAPLGGLFADVGDDAAADLVLRAHELGVRYFDTAPLYGVGNSERRYARALAQIPRDEFVLSTKVGRILVGEAPDSGPHVTVAPVFDFTRDGVLRSLEESLKRLGLDRVDIALIHDPDDHYEQSKTLCGTTRGEDGLAKRSTCSG